jgi:hypothetical protein
MTFELQERFEKESIEYFKDWPFMSHSNVGILDGNTILYSGHYALLHYLLFGTYKAAEDHSQKIYIDSKVDWGIINRGPHKPDDNQSHDDYIGLATMSFLGSGYVARLFYERGPSFYKRGSGSRAWFNSQLWRIPGPWQHLKLCAGYDLNWFDRFWWSLGIVSTSFAKKESTSGRLMDWHLRHVYRISKKNYWLCNLAMDFVEKRNSKIYPNLMGDVFSIYFTKEHILAKWSIGIK